MAGTMKTKGSAETPAANEYAFTNTNRWSTRQLVTMALLCAIGVLLSFVEFPLLPAVPWLKYDASAMPAMVCGFAFGPGAGFAVGLVGAVLHGLLLADAPGAVMNILVVAGFVIPAAMVYRRRRTMAGAIVGLALSIVAATLMAIVGNLVVTPLYLGVPLNAVVEMVIPILVPFNLLKAALNAVLTLVVYKAVSNLITPKKMQVKGR
ncbi:ECF transporter S component [Xiamenia xianingshaonis]|uniref:ECF transporter S component n=1 Tax=Xiamenia xianingshaonis TaxID=2682776 RepID=UPI0021BD40C7|nr:ECF transporter S component [Xiamenia xianingshaonis]